MRFNERVIEYANGTESRVWIAKQKGWTIRIHEVIDQQYYYLNAKHKSGAEVDTKDTDLCFTVLLDAMEFVEGCTSPMYW